MDLLETEQRVVVRVDWKGYQTLIELVGEQPRLRLTYDRGALEIMTTSNEHERKKSVIGRLLECLMLELGQDFVCGGSQTFQRQDLDRGIEPDECYWIQHGQDIVEMVRYDPELYPPPDLAVEVEVSRGLLNRIGIYGAMRVPEIWRWTVQEELHILCLTSEGSYVEQSASPTFPGFDPQVLARFARQGGTQMTSRVLHSFRDWLRNRP